MKALGVLPIECSVCKKGVACPINAQHLLDTILEAAEELERRCPKRYQAGMEHEGAEGCCWCGLAKKLRRSVGVEE